MDKDDASVSDAEYRQRLLRVQQFSTCAPPSYTQVEGQTVIIQRFSW